MPQQKVREEDMELLDILQQLEENNEDKIDLDSSLAPLSQSYKNFALSPQELDKETTAAALQRPSFDSESEDDAEGDNNVHDFSIALDSLDDLILKLTNSQTETSSPNCETKLNLPQTDGADDLLKTPTKVGKTLKAKKAPPTPTTPKGRRLTLGSPCRSPRTPKTGHKFAQLPLVSINRSADTSKTCLISGSNLSGVKTITGKTADRNSLPLLSLRKNLACSDLRRKSVSIDTNVEEIESPSKKSKSQKRSKRNENMDKTHITCALTPRRKLRNNLKVYNLKNGDKTPNENNEYVNNENSKAKDNVDVTSNKDQESQEKLKCLQTFERKFSGKTNKKQKHEMVSKKNCESVVNCSETEAACSSENDEEIVESDNDAELSLKIVRDAQRLKRLRRSFVATNSAKRSKSKTSHSADSSQVENSSIFLSKTVDDDVNSKNQLKLKTCAVRLRRIEKEVQNKRSVLKKEGEVKMTNSNIVTATDAVELENIERLNNKKTAQSNNVFIDQMAKEKKSYEKLLLVTYAKGRQKISQNMKNSQEDCELNKQSTENFEITVPCTDPSSNLLSNEISEEEIEEISPQENEKSPGNTHFYNKALSLQSPLLFTQNSSPVLFGNAALQKSKTPSRTNSLHSEPCNSLSSSTNHADFSSQTKLVITPMDLPPSREEVLKGCLKLQLPQFEFQQPFYSNPDDITKHKELGFTILQIGGNKLNDVEEFQSILGTDIKGLTAWRREQLMQLGGVEMRNKYFNAQRMREYFSSNKSVVITPQLNAPTRQDVKLWLKARELIKAKGEDLEELKKSKLDEDSPIKIRRQKVTMMLNAENSDNDNSDNDESLDCTSRSLTLTPLTPATPVAKQQEVTQKPDACFTPVTRTVGKISLKRDVSLMKRKNCRILKRVSLNRQLKETFEKEANHYSNQLSQSSVVSKDSQDDTKSIESVSTIHKDIVPNSQNSETSVNSEMALAELERPSFMRYIKESDVTIGGFTENSTVNNSFGFKVALENLHQAKADIEFNYLTIITLEVFVPTRGDLLPNPELDEIRCLFYAIENSIPNDHVEVGEKLPRKACGYIMVHDPRDAVTKEGRIHGIDIDVDVTIVQTEIEALETLLGLCSRWDPDIYAGYEIEMSSWGFVIDRAKFLCLNIAPMLSRVPTQKVRDFVDEDRETFTDLDIEIKLCGRILLDVWRLLRSEIALTSYSFENVMYHIMHKRCPWHSYRNLSEWFAAPCSRWIVIEYFLERVRGTLAILDQLDLIGRTSEMAKLIGIQFYEVLSRGSQFRVESMMLRIAKPKNLVPLSPSVQQRAHMRAPEYLPLIMEPQSRFYADPLIVLDFQSLYPSMIIAYNYCFSTCLGRVEHLGKSTPFEFGASQLRVSPAMLRKLVDHDLITISPCGVVFAKCSVREGILPRMLTEILDTRQMVKQSMKLHKSNSALQRILHSRQLGLKLMANVTYGYTAANFSGRMPAVEVGDSVVSKGRETLERAIKMVETNDKWNVRVVYGDTDSMFVLVPGRNRQEAFRIGEEIAEAVTKLNPHPVKLKLEKVYQPCILQTKKRYVGYMYETPDQKDPVYEAKGIETVRRDGCPLVAKMLEKVLRILFETTDVSQIKHYVCRQFTKLLSGRANLQDLVFAKEFRGLNGYRPTACVPALELTRKWIQTDPRRIPRRGERVPFIITNGPPGVPLIRLIRHPHEVLSDEGLKINAIYYITKAIIPPLNRCLLLIGADVNEWFASLPRKILFIPALSTANEVISYPNAKSKKSTISQFFSTTNCITDCGRQTKKGICVECSQNATRSVIVLQWKISKIERSYLTTQTICQACCGRVGDIRCGSLDCPVLYVLEMKRRDLQQIVHFRNLMEERFK